MRKPEWYQGVVIAAYRGKGQIEAVLNKDSEIKSEQRRAADEAARMSGGNIR